MHVTDKKDTPALSVVVLCYKSGERTATYVAEIEQGLLSGGITDYELVLVGNYFPGNDDATPEVVRRLAATDHRVVPVVLEKKGMMGWDMKSGFNAARGEAIVVIDGDGQMPLGDVIRLYKIFKSGEFDVVKTFRKTRMDGFYRRMISYGYNMVFRLLFPGTLFHDVNAKPKLISREAYKRMRLTSDDWFIDAEIMLEALHMNMRITEVPTTFYKNDWRKSFVKIWDIFEFVLNLLRFRIKYWFNR